ncbi:hypothetical protein AB0M02_24610 [Actinoplanes sp. NPDC051861]|uniref:hypothetical protein n=1 Tax=Actinoplanes sp. NPDC051861 TaxID=3155170 RepID=UPI003414A1BD
MPAADARPARGRRRARPGGMRRAGRLRELLVAGVVDSFGMALGWTVVVLIATARGGLAEAALYNAAMLAGAVLSAPVTGWLARRFDGRTLLRGSAAVEVVLRLAVLGGLVAGAPSWSIAAAILLMHTAAWAGFAGMRAEVSVVNASPQSMTRYVMCIMGVEAAGTALAALLPLGDGGYPTGWLLGAIFVVYLGSLLPTVLSARRARIAPTPAAATAPVGHFGSNPHAFTPAARPAGRGRHAAATPAPGMRLPSPRLLAGGGAVMLIAAGPTLLAVPVVEELYGGAWVAGSAVAFCLGTLFATTAVTAIARLKLPALLRWSLWGLGMLAGWTLAPLAAPLVLLAQFGAGLAQTAFEGDMDARVAAESDAESVTRDLAYAASVRAMGSAISVRMLPMFIAAPSIGIVASGLSLVLGVTTVVLWAGLLVAPHLFRKLAH